MTAKTNSTEVIYSAALDLYQNQQPITRDTLTRATGYQLHIIDDRIKHMIDNGLLYRIEKGVYGVIYRHPNARVISKTILDTGAIKIEIGDDVLTLTPHEATMLGRLFMGEAMSFNMVELGQHMAAQNQIMHNMIHGTLFKSYKKNKKNNRQYSLFDGEQP